MWLKCQNLNALPLDGGILNQPHILMYCFLVIFNEQASWAIDKKKIIEVNKRLQERHQGK